VTDAPANKPKPPERRPVERELFGERFVDEYAWLREREDPAVRGLLAAEQSWAEAVLDARTPGLRAELYAQMRGRIKEDDCSVPSKDGPWLYYSRTELGDEYPRHCRRALSEADGPDGPKGREGPEQVYLDENQLAASHGADRGADQDGSSYFDLASLVISPDHRRCAFTVDLDGDELYTICFKDLDTGELLDPLLGETIEVELGCGAGMAWLDDEWLVYTRRDAAHRPWQAWRHRLGTPVADDLLIWQEDDPAFFISVYRTRSDAYVVLSLDSQVTSEVWLLATRPGPGFGQPRLVAARRQGVEYGVDHHECRGEERLFVLTNDGAQNFKIMVAPVPSAEPASPPPPWRELIGHRDAVLIEDLDAFAEHLIVWERADGLPRIRVIPLGLGPGRVEPDHAGDDGNPAAGEHLVAFPDPTYTVWSGSNPEFHAPTLRFGYSSLTTPTSVYDYDPRDRSRLLRKRTEVVGGHDPDAYASARVWATAADGERVPISLVWRRDGDRDTAQARPASARALQLYAYGAYGETSDPSFSSARLSLLDRGMVWAIAHVRGGGELGRRWYEAGKLEHKRNSFSDFIAAAEHLIAEGWTCADRLAGSGASAGGLLIGAVANERPDLFRALVADVPFVDVLNTMLDPSLPLVEVEREEWGDPTTEAGFRWIRGYSPYDNVRAQAYPDMLVTAGWNDPRVGYWEPVKWVARLRERKLDAREILLWTNLDAGHGGASGRFEYLHEIALEYAFLIDRLGLVRSPQ
jgi:oligopeptidase B